MLSNKIFRLSDAIEFFRIVAFCLVVFIVSRHFPLGDKSAIMNVMLLLFFALGVTKISKSVVADKAVIFLIILLSVHAIYSITLGNDVSLVFRFYVILLLVVLAYYSEFCSKKLWNTVVWIYLLHSFIVIGIAITLAIVFGSSGSSVVRNYFLLNQHGDVYTFGNLFYRVQIKGNALLPVMFMLCFHLWCSLRTKWYAFCCGVLFTATIFAGNFAFLIALTVFFMLYYLLQISTIRQLRRYMLSIIVGTVGFLLVGLNYVLSTLEKKSGSAGSSLGLRQEQLNLLLEDLNSSITDILIGKGLGNLLPYKTMFRDYTDAVYYELQAVYILNQTGFILFSLFSFFCVFLAFKRFGQNVFILIFLCYVMYAITNPYIFDTYHVLVVVLISSVASMFRNNQFDLVKKY